MKKVLFMSLAVAVAMTGFAQKPIVKKTDVTNQSVLTKVQAPKGNEAPVANFQQHNIMTQAANHNFSKSFEEWETMTTIYDLQSNSGLGNRMVEWPDGSVALVMTWGNDGSAYSNRGTGYNYYSAEEGTFGDQPEDRIESIYSGWPSIAPLGEGEVVASHGNSNVNLYKRDVKGEGEWQDLHVFEATTWPRIATTNNGQDLFVVSAEQDASNTLINYLYYSHSTDGGETWQDNMVDPPLVDVAGDYLNNIGADDYIMATNGNTIAILFTSMNYDMFYIISRDNGQTWEKQTIWKFPYGHALDWNQTEITAETDSIWAPDNCASMAIDNNGVVHVAFPLTRWAPAPASGAGYYTYWPYTCGIVYWNSEYTNEKGDHDILPFGEWSGDSNFPQLAFNGANGISNTLCDERIWALAEEDGFKHLYLFGGPDENGDGVYDVSEYWDNHVDANTYRTHGIATMPSISVDEQGNIAIAYSVLSENRIYQGSDVTSPWNFRSIYITYKDYTDTWFDDATNLQADFMHSGDDAYYTTSVTNGHNSTFWFAYQTSPTPGLLIDNNGSPSELNTVVAVKVNADPEGWGVEEQEAVNPMTATRVYPNPATDVLNIEVNASQASEMSISVYNIMGQNVMNQNVNLTTGINTRSISTSELSSGIYFVTVKANGFENTMKFIVK